jgi:hypothetical protein
MNIILESFGDCVVDEIKPPEIDGWFGRMTGEPGYQESLQNVHRKAQKGRLGRWEGGQ